jgi:D-alanyl-D-alanine carboxypeptidase-like protein
MLVFVVAGCAGAPPVAFIPSSPDAPPSFAASVHAAPRARMTSSWRPGCPVAVSELRLVKLRYRGFDGRVHAGELVVHRDASRAVIRAFRRLFEARFPIARMRLVDAYGGSDERSMAANNTSAFNCRVVEDSHGVWSQHAYGRAIDVNPVQNAYVNGGIVRPSAGTAYLDRSRTARGMIRAGGPAVRAFAAVGWEWGGNWHSLKDYQHFSANGH